MPKARSVRARTRRRNRPRRAGDTTTDNIARGGGGGRLRGQMEVGATCTGARRARPRRSIHSVHRRPSDRSPRRFTREHHHALAPPRRGYRHNAIVGRLRRAAHQRAQPAAPHARRLRGVPSREIAGDRGRSRERSRGRSRGRSRSPAPLRHITSPPLDVIHGGRGVVKPASVDDRRLICAQRREGQDNACGCAHQHSWHACMQLRAARTGP